MKSGYSFKFRKIAGMYQVELLNTKGVSVGRWGTRAGYDAVLSYALETLRKKNK